MLRVESVAPPIGTVSLLELDIRLPGMLLYFLLAGVPGARVRQPWLCYSGAGDCGLHCTVGWQGCGRLGACGLPVSWAASSRMPVWQNALCAPSQARTLCLKLPF